MSSSERQEARMSLNVPVRVAGYDSSGKPWEEMTSSTDASRRGASFMLAHPVEKGELLHLVLPLPKIFRGYDINEPSYKVFALVRNVVPLDNTIAQVGVLFLGRTPPRDYLKNPAMRYLLPHDPPPSKRDRRGEERRTVFVTLKLLRDNGVEELTVAEDLSRGGSRVPTSLPVQKGEIVMVEEHGGDFRTRAEVRNVFVGEDGITRLNLKFIGGVSPDRLLG